MEKTQNPFELIDLRLQTVESLLYSIIEKQEASVTEENDILTADQIAKLLSVSLPTVYGYVHFKQIPFMKRRGKLYFSRKEVEEWLKGGRRMTRAESIRASLDTLSR